MLAQLGRLAEEITDAAADDRTRRRAEGFADSGLTRNRPRIAATVALRPRIAALGGSCGGRPSFRPGTT